MLFLFGLRFVLVVTGALVMGEDCSSNSTLDAPMSPTKSNISTPYYPHGYPVNMTCGWYITAPEDHIVKLQFTLSSAKFPFENAQVYDVDGSDLSLVNLERFYPEIFSKSRSVYILFKNDKKDAIIERIFVRYTAIKSGRFCSSQNSFDENMNILLRDPSGVIKTPGYPYGYTDESVHDCYWKLIAPKGNVVRVTFTTFQIHTYDRVQINDNWNDWYPWSIDKRGPGHSFTVYSTGRELGIKVYGHQYPEKSGPGFIANYTMVPGVSLGTCITKENSTLHMFGKGRSFSTPGFPLNPGIGTCRWNITVPLGEFVKLTFWDFKGTCDENYVQVFDVANFTSKFLGKVCVSGYVKEQVIYSKGNNVIVQYSSLSAASDKNGGLVATYEALKVIPARYSCFSDWTINLNDTFGEFASFGYPLLYPNNVKCSWVIEAPVGYIVQLTFHSFNLQQSQGCQADFIEIKQGKRRTSLVGRFCGSALPPVIESNYSTVYVDFVADSFKRYPGFHASYTVMLDPAVGPCNLEGVDNVIPMSGEAGRLFSPHYPPGTPPRTIMCTWIIAVPEGHYVKLRLTSYDLGMACRNYSTLAIRDGQNPSSALLKSFCTRQYESSFFSSGRYLWVRFHSPKQDWSDNFWFTAEFEAVTQLPAPYSCTASNRQIELNSETGVLASYNYPLPYDDYGGCTWIIRVDGNKHIELSFDFFNLSDPSPECLDYVQIGNEALDYGKNIPKFCGSEKPSPVNSKGSAMWVWFTSSGNTKYPGFKASYKTKLSVIGILKIVAICLGVTTACVLIGIVSYKYFKSRRNQRMYGDDTENVPLHEQAI